MAQARADRIYRSGPTEATLARAAVGGVAGNVVTGGSTAGTLGGAAVGGIVGHEVTRP